MIINRRRRALRGALAATVVTLATAATAGSAFAADDPAASAVSAEQRAQDVRATPGARAAAAADAPVETPTFTMTAVHKQSGVLYHYYPNRTGGFAPRYEVGVDFEAFADSIYVDNDKDGYSDGTWHLRKDGELTFGWIDDDLVHHSTQTGRGWNIYTSVLSPGSIGGAQEADLIGLDKAGVLWGYQGYADGRVTARTRIGGGWGQYTQLAGQGDLTGDGKADIVARDRSGVLWLYKGTGNYKAPFAARTTIGAGWNAYDRLLSVGDLDADGRTDLVARKPNGELLRYSGTGDAQAPFQKPVKIGYGFQNYNLL
ncbi:VCBS repeat-containing protein [Streptomyces sp. Je 1-79]|uniref:FG-GAP repeat domain-containing protein n=1 Tax=Streptomyces sp. Je 1-79 TaxID=2943847 RepID=UPI0021A54625|nr:VCBS repeat-containing protein [Streptomyces sp. Je 1-79]MCT4356546.1 VCBS repeat-containing protein [Streptomyces sp. Je 1-79]